MIDNAMHDLLCAAADQAGWDEESMMLHATRFLSRLADDNADLEQRFQDYLQEQVVDEALAGAEPGASAYSDEWSRPDDGYSTGRSEPVAPNDAQEDDIG